MKELGRGTAYNQRNIVDSYRSIMYQTSCRRKKPSRWKSINTHTHKLQNLLPRTTFITFYTAFVRPHLDYGYILYDQPFSSSFHDRLESVQYKVCLAITGQLGVHQRKIISRIRFRISKASTLMQKALSFL